MIQRDGHTIHFVCDACPADLDTETSDWAAANAARKAARWWIEKVGDEWLHLCPTCKARERR